MTQPEATASSIDGLYNFRDTGGLPLADGGRTRPGVLFRSDALAALTPTGLDQLSATDIGVIVDFRTAQERQSAPDRIPTARPFQVVDLPMLEGAMADMTKGLVPSGAAASSDALAAAMSSLPSLGQLYVDMLGSGAPTFAEVARRVAATRDDEPTAVLVHCTAGKDRTGVATALLLEAAGVQRPAVVADYAASEANLSGAWADGMIHMISSFGIPLTPELRALVMQTPPEAIETALTWVDAQHGGAAGYLLSGGLTGDELAALRQRLAA